MTNEQINAAIAEVCGWTEIGSCDCGFKISGMPPYRTAHKKHLTDYCNDLNAMHEAEGVLDDEQYIQFTDRLYETERVRQGQTQKWRWLSSTARQRAEAFLRTLGKWEGTTKESSTDHFRDSTKKEEVQP